MRRSPATRGKGGNMIKKILVEFESDWVLSRRGDDILPVNRLADSLKGDDKIKSMHSTLTSLELTYDAQDFNEGEVVNKLRELIRSNYPDEESNNFFTVTAVTNEPEPVKCQPAETAACEDETSQDEGEDDENVEEDYEDVEEYIKQLEKILGEDKISKVKSAKPDENKLTEIDEQVRSLVGAAEFKALTNELRLISKEIIASGKRDIFLNQCYLFSIGDGCGLTTYLEILAKYAAALGLCEIDESNSVKELELENKHGNDEDTDKLMSDIKTTHLFGVKVLCIDISEWMDKTETGYFKEFLQKLSKETEKYIIVFRVPFLEKDVLERVRLSLGDLLFVRQVTFPPFSLDEIKQFAKNTFAEYDFTLTEGAWKCFMERIAEEKSDGRFYGANTIKKVVRELVYKKQLINASSKNRNSVIKKSEAETLCLYPEEKSLTAMQQLDKLVGIEKIKSRVLEIVAQIELSMRDETIDPPCIHMRFTGNPGTGKTTVARIIGRILKEKGVLRVGNFYECFARDLCGRYVGETAPKTASMCRDAYGSVLFIDEAYSLYRGDEGSRDYGREAIDTLIAEMENHRNDFMVILAGYTEDMDTLMKANQGLASRVPYVIEFPNFSREQLFLIFKSMAEGKFSCDKGFFDAAEAYFNGMPDSLLSSKTFSNARFVRNLFERTWAKAAMRCQLGGRKEVVLTKEDFEHASADKEFILNIPKKTRIGF